MKQPSTAVSLHYYQQAVTFTVNVTKSPYKAVTFYVCYILRYTIYMNILNKVCQVDYVHLEADLGYIYSYKNL